jgi:hypothetical protein
MASPNSYDLLSNAAVVTGNPVLVTKGRYAWSVWGTSIGQAKVVLERKVDGGDNWLSMGTDAEFSTFNQIGVELPGGIYRARVVDGGTDPVGLYATLEPLA